ncbi:MAG: UDP-N-acetylmuramoyl-L-alanine--D-glutamate ligase [Proteobacteria bacterium]|nr:UDP-N-acetylmuramoyl-L-alanine--D-glutamate ligase [Pseudomonadota bacterium]
MELQGKKVLVVGLARTGIAAARFLARQGVRLKISEAKPAQEIEAARKALQDLPVEWELGGHTIQFFGEEDLIVVSPGVPMDIEPLVQARANGIPVISEMELAFKFLRRPLIGITGTNGKTTTTTLIGEMLRASGRKAFVGGNIGNPLIEYVGGPQEEEWVVAEISSFQLEGIVDFRPQISILLNITEDHLDRYPNFQEYIRAKGKILQNQGKDDYTLLNADDPLTFQFAHRVESQVILFSSQRAVPVGCFLEKGAIFFQGGDGKKERFGLERLKIRGAHNLENIMAAVAAGKICGCPSEVLQKVMEEFPGLEHRLEWVQDIDGVSFFNDSKGTNVGSVVKSLMSFREPVLLIAGGKDKGGDYSPLKNMIVTQVKGMALIGEAQERMEEALGGLTETVQLGTLEEAVHWASSKASPGDVVLLSPACSSFDMFENYQERGKRFKTIVQELSKNSPGKKALAHGL